MTDLVSCITPTYARYPAYGHLLEECVESFLRQDYPNKELVILNDCPGQILACKGGGHWDETWTWHDGTWANKTTVRVVNCGKRYATLGEKFNRLIELSKGDLICPWEDDDLSLPWRLTQAVERLGTADYWKPQQVVYLETGKLPVFRHPVGVRHHASIFRKSAWSKVGGYPETSTGQDAAMDSRLRTCTVAPEGDVPPERWAYIYRWGVSPVHLSGMYPHCEEFYAQVGRMPVVSGEFQVVPRWREDYAEVVARALKG